MRLSYELAATGVAQLRTVLRSVEKEAAASNRRMATDATRTARQTTRSAASPMFAPGRREQQAALRQHEKALIASERARLREALNSSKAEVRARLGDEKTLARAKEMLDRQRSRSLLAIHKQDERARNQSTKTVRRAVGRGTVGALRSTAAIGAATAGVLGGVAVGNALAEESNIRRQSAVLANQAGDPSLKGALASESTSVRGFTGSEVLGAQSRFVGKTGDLGTARQIKGSMGDLALATGSDLGDLMETAGQAFNVLKDQISDPIKRLEELNGIMATLAQQGAMGAVEIKDLAQDFGKLGAATRGFEGAAPDLLRTMGAFAQVAVARGGAESSADASTAAARMVGDIVTNRKKFGALGVDIKSKQDPTKLRDPMAIMADVLEKTGGDVTKTSGLFGMESAKIFKGFAATFSEAEKKEKGSGKGAVMAEFERFAGAKLGREDVERGAQSVLEEPDMQFKEAMKAFNTAVGKDLLPAITQLVPQFTQMIPHMAAATGALATFAGWFAQNPLGGIGAVIAASIAKDMAGAGIEAAFAKASMGALGFTGAALAAAAALGAAVYNNEQLKNETGGKGILDVGWEWATTDKGLKEIADENLDKQAKERAASRTITPPGTIATGAAGNGMAAAAAGAPGSPGAPGVAAGGQELGTAAQQLKEAAGAMKQAAGAMPKDSGKGVSEASRTAPIISPSRG